MLRSLHYSRGFIAPCSQILRWSAFSPLMHERKEEAARSLFTIFVMLYFFSKSKRCPRKLQKGSNIVSCHYVLRARSGIRYIWLAQYLTSYDYRYSDKKKIDHARLCVSVTSLPDVTSPTSRNRPLHKTEGTRARGKPQRTQKKPRKRIELQKRVYFESLGRDHKLWSSCHLFVQNEIFFRLKCQVRAFLFCCPISLPQSSTATRVNQSFYRNKIKQKHFRQFLDKLLLYIITLCLVHAKWHDSQVISYSNISHHQNANEKTWTFIGGECNVKWKKNIVFLM